MTEQEFMDMVAELEARVDALAQVPVPEHETTGNAVVVRLRPPQSPLSQIARFGVGVELQRKLRGMKDTLDAMPDIDVRRRCRHAVMALIRRVLIEIFDQDPVLVP